tara:strand:+ start:1373 stop:1771 length:399 start_codon:yes stop_codon:yes gene_type:complete
VTDNSVFKDDRKLTYLNVEGSDKPFKSPVSDDSLDRSEPHIAKLGVDLAIGYDLSIAQMRTMGLYISKPRSDAESPRPFAEPGLFVINSDGTLQVTDISNGPFVRPHLETLVGGLEFIRNPEHNYPIRGMLT